MGVRLVMALTTLIVFILTGCATAISVQITKPSQINLEGAKTIAVLPFGFPSQPQTPELDPLATAVQRFWSSSNSENQTERHVAQQLTATFEEVLTDSKIFTVFKNNDLRNLVGDIADPNAKSLIKADVVVTGALLSLTNSIDDRSFRDKDNNPVFRFYSNVELRFRYEVIKLATGQVIDSKTLTGSDSTLADSPYDTTPVESQGIAIILRLKDLIQQQLTPFTVTEERYLAADTLKDPRMAQADQLVKDQFYEKAYYSYVTIYNETKNFAAGFNAAIVKEVLGNLPGALVDMKVLAATSGDAQAAREVQRMTKTLDEVKRQIQP